MFTFPVTLYASAFATVTNTTNVDASAGSVANNYTFTAAALGTPHGLNSLVVVVADIYSNGTNPVIQSISIDGTNGTLLQAGTTTNSLTFDAGTAIASRATSNTSGDIIVRANNGSVRSRISVFRLNYLVSSTANDSQKAGAAGAGAISVNLSVPNAGIVIAGGATINPADATVPVLSGITQAANGVLGINLYKWAYGFVQNQPVNASRTVTVTPNVGALGSSMVAASWH